MLNKQYFRLIYASQRRNTMVVNIGNVPMGGDYPVRIQSMTNTNTLDTNATVAQCIRIIKAGADYVRMAVPGIKDAQNLQVIKQQLRNKGYNTPMIADVHFNPKVAETAARFVEKIRINPGNYVDKKRFQQLHYTDCEYRKEIEKIQERFILLLDICKANGTAIRIGTNHGSLSDRIISRYGNTPEGMVEATMEFLRICRDYGFYEVVISLKSSNTKTMIQANRLMAEQMDAEDLLFPLHLGVTEAGEGEDGRIKSAVGIGTLLAEGIGDTIRVSLTEPPENEIPVAQKLIDIAAKKHQINGIQTNTINHNIQEPYNPFVYNRRQTIQVLNIGANQPPVVIASQEQPNNRFIERDIKPDFLFVETDINKKSTIPVILPYKYWLKKQDENQYPLFEINELEKCREYSSKLNFVKISSPISRQQMALLKNSNRLVLVIRQSAEQIYFTFQQLTEYQCNIPVVLQAIYNENDLEILQLRAAAQIGSHLVDGFGDGIWINNKSTKISAGEVNSLAFGILQSTGTRISRTEYISCPSCGRTNFDLQAVTAAVKQRTVNMHGFKIAVMGCIVNGPGEMADADYGYVGSGKDKVTLYRKKEIVKRNIDASNAVDELVKLIKNDQSEK